MSFRDEEDLFLSPSSRDYSKSREQSLQNAREQKAKQKGKLLSLKRMLLRGQIQQDESAVSEASENAEETFGTKTQKQIEDSQIVDAQKEFTPDDLIGESHRNEEKKKDQEEERANDDV